MAYIPNQNNLFNPTPQQQQMQTDTSGNGPGNGAPPTIQNPNTSAGSNVAGAGGGLSNTAQGSAMNPAFTNIQAYLNANKGNTGSAGALTGQVNNDINSEQSKFNDQLQKDVTQSDAEKQKTNIGQDQASNLIQQATANGTGSQAYEDSRKALGSALNSQYGGPNSVGYNYGNDFNTYATGLGANATPEQRQAAMNNIYRMGSGGQIGAGALALQTQLDTDPQAQAAIESARQGALSNIANYQNQVGTKTTDANNQIAANKAAFGDNQNNLRSYLLGQGQGAESGLNSMVNQYNTEEDAIRNNPALSGRDTYLYEENPLNFPGTPNKYYEYLNHPDYYQYQNGNAANIGNVAGGHDIRNKYNFLANVLGVNPIQEAQNESTHGTTNFDADRYQNAVRALDQKYMSKGAVPIDPATGKMIGFGAGFRNNYQTGHGPTVIRSQA